MVVAKTDAAVLAKRWRKACRSLDGGIRVAYLRSELLAQPLPLVAQALDEVCSAAEQAEPDARELLIAVVDLMTDENQSRLAQQLREEAAGAAHLALARPLRRAPFTPRRPAH